MLKDLKQGDTFPDYELPGETGALHRLSELQGDNCLVLMLGRGEHCPRERQHQREMLRLHGWCAVAFTQMVTSSVNATGHISEKGTMRRWCWRSRGQCSPRPSMSTRQLSPCSSESRCMTPVSSGSS